MTRSPHFLERLADIMNSAAQSAVTRLPHRDVGYSTPAAAWDGQATLVLTDRGVSHEQ